MSIMVNRNRLYVPVSDILLPDATPHGNVLDSSGNEYFAKETFPIQLHMLNSNKCSCYATASDGRAKDEENTQSVVNSNNEKIYLSQYVGKRLYVDYDITISPANQGVALRGRVTVLASTSNDDYELGHYASYSSTKGRLNIDIPELADNYYLRIKLYCYMQGMNVARSVKVTVSNISINNI